MEGVLHAGEPERHLRVRHIARPPIRGECLEVVEDLSNASMPERGGTSRRSSHRGRRGSRRVPRPRARRAPAIQRDGVRVEQDVRAPRLGVLDHRGQLAVSSGSPIRGARPARAPELVHDPAELGSRDPSAPPGRRRSGCTSRRASCNGSSSPRRATEGAAGARPAPVAHRPSRRAACRTAMTVMLSLISPDSTIRSASANGTGRTSMNSVASPGVTTGVSTSP